MKKLKRWMRKWWWLLVALVSAMVFVLVKMLESKRNSTSVNPTTPFHERAKAQVERVRLEGEIEKARVTARADERSAQLDDIERVGENDPVEARRQLSSWLSSNL